jgi:hypothetical protein
MNSPEGTCGCTVIFELPQFAALAANVLEPERDLAGRTLEDAEDARRSEAHTQLASSRR